jgi:hypothetical protein
MQREALTSTGTQIHCRLLCPSSPSWRAYLIGQSLIGAPTACLAFAQGTDDGKTAEALQAVFQEASRYAPCILMLQQLELLTSSKGVCVCTCGRV